MGSTIEGQRINPKNGKPPDKYATTYVFTSHKWLPARGPKPVDKCITHYNKHRNYTVIYKNKFNKHIQETKSKSKLSFKQKKGLCWGTVRVREETGTPNGPRGWTTFCNEYTAQWGQRRCFQIKTERGSTNRSTNESGLILFLCHIFFWCNSSIINFWYLCFFYHINYFLTISSIQIDKSYYVHQTISVTFVAIYGYILNWRVFFFVLYCVPFKPSFVPSGLWTSKQVLLQLALSSLFMKIWRYLQLVLNISSLYSLYIQSILEIKYFWRPYHISL